MQVTAFIIQGATDVEVIMSGNDLNTEFDAILKQVQQCLNEIVYILNNGSNGISRMPEVSDALSKLTSKIEDFDEKDPLKVKRYQVSEGQNELLKKIFAKYNNFDSNNQRLDNIVRKFADGLSETEDSENAETLYSNLKSLQYTLEQFEPAQPGELDDVVNIDINKKTLDIDLGLLPSFSSSSSQKKIGTGIAYKVLALFNVLEEYTGEQLIKLGLNDEQIGYIQKEFPWGKLEEANNKTLLDRFCKIFVDAKEDGKTTDEIKYALLNAFLSLRDENESTNKRLKN